MALSQWVQGIRDNILTDIKNNLLTAWLRHREDEINQKCSRDMDAKRPEILRNYRYVPPAVSMQPRRNTIYTWDLPQYTPPPPATRIINGITIKEDDYWDYQSELRRTEENIREGYKREAREAFNEHWMTTLRSKFYEATEALKPDAVKEALFTRHPWLKEDGDASYWGNSYGLTRIFITNYLRNNLLNTFSHGHRLYRWADIDRPTLDRGNFAWDGYDFERDPTFQNTIDGHPFSPEARYANPLTTYRSILLTSALRHNITRIDMFRYLHSRYPAEMQSTEIRGIHTPKIMPIGFSELAKLMPAQLQHTNALLVDVSASEGNDRNATSMFGFGRREEPNEQWLLLYKTPEGNGFRIYLPSAPLLDTIAAKHRALVQTLTEKGFVVETVTLDYTQNLTNNDIGELPQWSLWQAIVLGRILPGCIAGVQDLSTYHATTPIALFLQKVLSFCFNPANPTQFAKCFGLRAPFSRHSLAKLISDYFHDCVPSEDILFRYTPTINRYLESASHLDNKLNLLQTGAITITGHEEDYLTLNQKRAFDENASRDAMSLVYHQSIPRLVMDEMVLEAEWFDYARDLEIVIPASGHNPADARNLYYTAWMAAARNRFLKRESPATLRNATTPILLRDLWSDVGLALIAFYRNNRETLKQTRQIELLRERSTEWSANHFDYPNIELENVSDEAIWSLAQVAQMGTQGLDALFLTLESGSVYQWNAKLKSPKPNFPLVLDLQGRIGETANRYIEHLTHRIKYFDISKRGVAPLFSELTLLLPTDYANAENLAAIQNLMHVLDKRYRDNKEDTHDVSFQGLDINSRASGYFIEQLEALADEENLCIQVHFPAWDEAAFETQEQRALKARYKALQNRIAENQRLRRAEAVLEQNFQAITTVYEHEGDEDEIEFDQALFQEAQPFELIVDGERDPFYPLASSTLGIQQQQQQQQQAQQEAGHTAEDVVEQEQEQEIGVFSRDESLLVTRDSIHGNARCQQAWTSTPDAVKALSGHVNHHLGGLFSLWVGSQEDATHVIRRMEPKAVERIMSHASQFRFGISKDNLPPGFYLATGRRESDGLILCFDKEREQEALCDLEAKSIEERNPFTLTLYDAKPKQVFAGDFRQFNYIAEDVAVQQTLWKHCAYEEVSDVRHAQACAYLNAHHAENAVSDEDISPVMQLIDLRNACAKPLDYATSLNALSNWASEHIFTRVKDDGATSKRLLSLLFDTTEESSIKPEQLKAFGQLFHAYESGLMATPQLREEKNPFVHDSDNRMPGDHVNTGLGAWLRVGYAVLDAFGEANFKLWKKHVADSSSNWTECLDASEMDALAISMMKLRGKPELTNLWFHLLDKHGRSTGQVRYAKLWHAFERVLQHIEKRKLDFDMNKMHQCFDACGDNFNGIVLLDRMRYTLRKASTCAYPEEVQNAILSRVADIDWRHNGYYYAARYNKHSYWDEDLWFRAFERTLARTPATYETSWPAHLNVLGNGYVHALRFASGRMKLNHEQFLAFKAAITPFKGTNLSHAVLRLMTASRAIGVDRSCDLTRADLPVYVKRLATISPPLLSHLNTSCSLDAAGLVRGSLQMRFQDMAVFLETCVDNKRLSDQFRYGTQAESSLVVLNHYGRALDAHAYLLRKRQNGRIPTDETKKAFLNKLSSQHPRIIQVFPWLIDDENALRLCNVLAGESSDAIRCNQSMNYFMKQLQTIDFNHSKALPTATTLIRHFNDIFRSRNPDATRKACVDSLVRGGCRLRQLDAGFIPLPEDSHELANASIVPRLKRIFSPQNAPLCKTFIEEYVAIPVQGSAEDHMAPLLDLFVKIDNKPHYNELGQLLGLLIKKAKAVPADEHGENAKNKQYYSVPQLVEWLNALIDGERYHNTHYPLSLLEALLDAPALASVLNDDLNQLQAACYDSSLLRRVEYISTRPIPNQYKPVLIKLELEVDKDVTNELPHRATLLLANLSQNHASRQYLSAVNRLLLHFSQPDHYENAAVEDLLESLCVVNPASEAVQMFLIDSFINETLSSEDILRHFKQTEDLATQQWQCVFGYALQKTMEDRHRTAEPLVLLERVKREYTQWIRQVEGINAVNARHATEQLVHYYETEPRPSLDSLSYLLTANPLLPSVDALIHHFESVEQGLKPSREEKRHYSITPDERGELLRVLDGFKCKRKGDEKGFIKTEEQNQLLNLLYYTNQFAQVHKLKTLTLDEIRAKWEHSASKVRTEGDAYASAEMLACQREILLRKTGMWANHTQMLAELYAALYNDESLVYQMKTGQGKSILTALRVSFLAGTGHIVDSFSSKESLSSRDQEEFAPYLDALRIRHSYVTPNAAAGTYHSSLQNHIGAVNYMTPSNFSLFQAKHIWEGEHDISYDKAIRVAFADELDHILRDEQTQANYASGGEKSVYNYDEWVYREAYEFFLENKARFISKDDGVTPGVYRKEHLEPLCERLQTVAKHAPKESQFMQRFMVPALSGNAVDIKKRDEKLKQLMTAAYTADKLKDGPDFCKRPVYKNIGGVDVRTRFAKVVIKNQVREGSTYSDLVQQFLHTKLNRDAVRSGEKPDFFVEPESEIALSQNVLILMKKYYAKIEGCTGTAGGESDLHGYANDYGINHVVKLPTHEQLVSQYEPGIYATSEKTQIDALVGAIDAFKEKGPILITCEDDIAVKRFAALLKARNIENINLITDTNDSGRTEKEVLPIAGNRFTVVVSSRMGRGTDIRPEKEARDGLKVIRTYAAIPRVTKQEFGRQGRNGHPGRCQEILNYAAIDAEYDRLNQEGALDVIYEEEEAHLNRKLIKHEKLPRKEVARDDGTTWAKAAFEVLSKDARQKACYLRTRTLVRYKHELKVKHDSFLRQREAFNAKCSEAIKDALKGARNVEPNLAEREILVQALKDMFIAARKDMDALWNMRLTGGNITDDVACENYLRAAEAVWRGVVAANDRLLSAIPAQDFEVNPPERYGAQVRDPSKSISYGTMTEFYQGYVKSAEGAYFNHEVVGRVPDDIIAHIFGAHGEDMTALYDKVREIGEHEAAVALHLQALANRDDVESIENLEHVDEDGTDEAQPALIFEALASAVTKKTASLIACKHWQDVIDLFNDNRASTHFDGYGECLTNFLEKEWLRNLIDTPEQLTVAELEKVAALFSLTMKSILTAFIDEATPRFVTNLTEVVHEHLWDTFTDADGEILEALFCTNEAVTKTLMLETNQADLGRFITLYKEATPERRAGLFACLEGQSAELVQSPEALRAVFELTLSGEQCADDPLQQLPQSLNLVPNLVPTINARLWHFLTQRPDITRAGIHSITQPLAEHEESADLMSRVIEPLLEVPSYVPLQYIAAQTRFTMGAHSLEPYRQRLEGVRAAGAAFCDFLVSRGVIQSAHEYMRIDEAERETFDTWQQNFSNLTPQENQVFFTMAAQEATLGMDTIESLYESYQTGRIPRTRQALNQAMVAMRLIESEVQDRLARKSLKDAWDTACLQNMQQLQDAIRVTKKIEALKRTQNWDAYFKALRCTKAEDRREMVQYVVHGIISFGDAFDDMLFNAYLKLLRSLKWIFLPETGDALEERHQKMRANYAALIELTKELAFIVKPPHRIEGDEDYDDEAYCLADPALQRRANATTHLVLQNYFKSQEARYAECWWTNQARRKQARDLFGTLNRIASVVTTDRDFYRRVFDVIVRAEQGLLLQDERSALRDNYKLNTKGYSRLYHIMDEMFITMAKEFVKNKGITIQDKAEFKERFDNQLDFQLTMLIRRLPQETQAKRLLMASVRDGNRLPEQLSFLLMHVNRSEVPSDLHYLLDNLECLEGLTQDLGDDRNAVNYARGQAAAVM